MKPENHIDAAKIKALVYKASAFTKNGNPVPIKEIEKIHSFAIEEGDFYRGKYRFTGTATISIGDLSQLYEFDGLANDNEIIGNINIKQSH